MSPSSERSRPVNIVLVGPFGLAPKGTVSWRVLPLARALARARACAGDTTCQVSVVVPSWDNPREAGRVWYDQGVRVVHVSLAGGVPGILTALVQTTLQQQPAVVHCFKPKGYAGLVLWLLWQARRAGLWQGRLLVDTDDWEAGWNDRIDYPAPLPALFAWQETWCLRHADGVTAASRWLLDLAAGLRSGARHVRHLPNGVEVGDPIWPAVPAASRPPTVLLYTRFVEVTPARVLRVWHAVRQGTPNARLIVAGDSLPPAAARHLASMAGADGGLHCLGWVPEPALPAVLAAADVAWVPSATTLVARARCPVKLVELMRAGLPIVADASGEALTYLRHGIDGVLVWSTEDGEAAQALCSLLNDRPRAAAHGRAAAARVRAEFTWDHLATRADQFYQELHCFAGDTQALSVHPPV